MSGAVELTTQSPRGSTEEDPEKDDDDIFVNEPLGEEEHSRRTSSTPRSKCLLVAGLAVFLTTILVVSFVFVAGVTNDNNNTTQSQSNQQAAVLVNFQRQLARPDTLQKIQQEPNSAQASAYQWMRHDPNLVHYPQWRLVPRFALATLYYSLNGPSWPLQWQDSWLNYDVDECQWERSVSSHADDLPVGVAASVVHGGYEACGGGDYHRIVLSGIETLEGSLPPEISLLTALKEIELTDMLLKMSLDNLLVSDLQLLTGLRRIDFTNLHLAGSTLPTELGLLTSLQELHISGGALGGTLPSELFGMPNLRELSLESNFIGGTLPAGKSSSLETLWLHGNQLSGSLPSEWSALNQSLDSIYLKNNRLTGSLPTEWSALMGLLDLRLSHNQLEGSIPSQYGQHMNALKYFGFDGNAEFGGSVPAQWCERIRNDEMFFWLDCNLVQCCNR